MFYIAVITLVSVLPAERVIRIDVASHNEVYQLARLADLSITDAQKEFVTAIASDEAIEKLRSLGYRVTVLVADARKQAALDLATYYTYAEVCSIVRLLAEQYPHICQPETLGLSAGGRWIPAVKVTNQPRQATGRPRIRLIGAHHGNEKISTEITLSFLQYLCSAYELDPAATRIVNEREVWIIPILNPDGHISNSRYNAAGRDLNRDYGYEWQSYSEPYSQPETRALFSHSETHIPTLEFAYHSTAAYVNYLWDNHPADPPDSAWIISLSRRYADSTYGSTTTRLTPINGYNWYEVHGSCQDCTFGAFGGLAWTIETALPSTRPRIDSICLVNRRALVDFCLLAGYGISGFVYDSVTGQPVFARVEFLSPWRWTTYTNMPAGDFHKMLAPGEYSLRVWSSGYEPRTLTGIVVTGETPVVLNIPLNRKTHQTWLHAQKIVAVRRNDDNHLYNDWVIAALGEPDGNFYHLGSGTSSVIFDVDPYEPVHNHLGHDITVTAVGSYSLAAAEDWRGPWYTLGNATGNASFDLDAVGLGRARYLRITNSASCALDGISYLGQIQTDVRPHESATALPFLNLWPSVAAHSVHLRLQAASTLPLRIRITDATGKTVRQISPDFANPDLRFTWDLSDDHNRPLPTGVYFVSVDGGSQLVTQKLVVARF